MLEVKHLTVCSKEGKPLVRDVSFTLIPGEPLGLTGASGSGKTTIIKAIMGILPYGCDVKAARFCWMGSLWKGFPPENGGNTAEQYLASSHKVR